MTMKEQVIKRQEPVTGTLNQQANATFHHMRNSYTLTHS